MNNFTAWLKLWGLRKGWFVIIPITIIAICIWNYLAIPPVEFLGKQNPQSLYLLSAIAQSLAAVLALVFTISLVIAQLASRYSHRLLVSFFDKWTILYILMFVLSVLLPLWLLTKPNTQYIKVSLILAEICLFFLVPYFLSFKEKLNPESLISDLRNKALKKLNKNPTGEPEECITIDNFVKSAIELKDYDTFDLGIRSLKAITMAIIKNTEKEGEALPQSYMTFSSITERIKNNCIESIDSPRIPPRLINDLYQIGEICIENKLGDFAGKVCGDLGWVGMRAVQKGYTELILSNEQQNNVINKLMFIGEEAASNDMQTPAFISAQWIEKIASIASQKKMDEIVSFSSSKVRQIGDKFVERKSNSAATMVIQLSKIGYVAIDNELERPSGWIAADISNLGMEAAESSLVQVSNEAANALNAMGQRAAEKGQEIALEGITRGLLDLGINAIEHGLNESAKHAVEGLCTTAHYVFKYSKLASISERAIRFSIELGIKSTIYKNSEMQEDIIKKLIIVEQQLGNFFVESMCGGIQNSIKDKTGERYTAVRGFVELYRLKHKESLTKA